MSTITVAAPKFKFRSRGLGNNWLPCFLCGHKPQQKCQNDTAFFVDAALVKSIELDLAKPIHMHPVMDLFFEVGLLATLVTSRMAEGRVQVKLGACGEHVPNLELITALTTANGDQLTEQILRMSIPGRKIP